MSTPVSIVVCAGHNHSGEDTNIDLEVTSKVQDKMKANQSHHGLHCRPTCRRNNHPENLSRDSQASGTPMSDIKANVYERPEGHRPNESVYASGSLSAAQCDRSPQQNDEDISLEEFILARAAAN